MAEQFQRFAHGFGLLHMELEHRPGRALLAHNLARNAAAAVHALHKVGDALGLCLQHDAALVKIFAEAGRRISRGPAAAGAGDLAAQDLVFDVL